MRALVVALASLVFTASALADHLEPEKRIRAADQARAKAMLVRASDLPAGYAVERTSGLDPHVTCGVLDESDLVLTGEAMSPIRARDYRLVGSSAAVYRSAADSRSAWLRSTSRAARACTRRAFEDEFARQGESVRASVRPLALPAVGVDRYGQRVEIFGASASTPLVTLDLVLLRHGRAHAALLFAGVVVAPERALELRLSRVTARRMRAAMRTA